ncbi:diguanylate cyclase [Pseudooceanicola sp. 200-1SW]|uniref:GGDEF domain-containing response regulator n=1 Tax=Pseudooceanicola sp. 200-1SW TaxID=3425949 RepID=UPI003D7F84E2
MPGRILILDNDMPRRITLAARLAGAFYDIRLAEGLDEALAQAADWGPGMVLVADDLARAPATGVLRRLRATPGLAEAALLVVTAPGAQTGRSDLLVAGADDVIARSEPQEVFQARLRSHERAREVMDTLRPRDSALQLPGLSGLAEDRSRFRAPTRVSLLAPDADCARAWRIALGGAPDLRVHVSDLSAAPGPGDTDPGDPAGLLMLGLLPGDEARCLRLLARLKSQGDQRDREVLLFAPGARPRVQVQGFEIGAGAVMTGPFDAAEIVARLRLLRARLLRRRKLRRALNEGMRASITDPLTGLYNRRYALPLLAQITRRGAALAEPFAVMVADLDHFKRVNDRHGHAAGDLALQTVAEVMRTNLRQDDVLARIGGEEFLAILPGIAPDDALASAERLRRRVAASPVPLPQGAPIPLSISVGLTLGRAGRRSPEALLADADRALYAAKNAGRDRVICHSPGWPATDRGEALAPKPLAATETGAERKAEADSLPLWSATGRGDRSG